MNVEVIGKMDHTLDNTFESANRVYDTESLSPALNTCGGGGLQPKILEVQVLGGIGDKMSNNGTQYYQQDRVYNAETVCPALNSQGENLVPKIIETEKVPKIKVRQATQQGFIEVEVGGGRLELPNKPKTQRKGTRGRSDMPDSDNGEYP